jgi:hypothetical protein
MRGLVSKVICLVQALYVSNLSSHHRHSRLIIRQRRRFRCPIESTVVWESSQF